MLITSPFCPTMFEFVCMMMSSDVHSALLFAAWLPAAALAGGDARHTPAGSFVLLAVTLHLSAIVRTLRIGIGCLRIQ